MAPKYDKRPQLGTVFLRGHKPKRLADLKAHGQTHPLLLSTVLLPSHYYSTCFCLCLLHPILFLVGKPILLWATYSAAICISDLYTLLHYCNFIKLHANFKTLQETVFSTCQLKAFYVERNYNPHIEY